ncbi:LamG domain-containing protein [Halobacterium hubeiense]|uniref:LamG domain-containing protein n=1 Tax=Halobacterium hubeiense TaxID=1407499 RepID=UPI000B7E9C0E|nr:LamG domain-containing protein [Halobacterium hubeiense]
MSDVRDATDKILADRPSIEDDLRELLDIDANAETWTFDDVPVDSGAFGELVSKGIVEADGDEYRLADRAAIQAALEGETPIEEETTDTGPSVEDRLRRIDPGLAASLTAVLGLVVVMRTVFSWTAVFRGNDVVLSGNDVYFYRYWLEELLRTGTSVTSLPPALQDHDVAMIAATHTMASLLGGGQDAVSLVLAWYPVVAAVVVGVLVYVIAMIAFDDQRVALAGVAFYAITPIVAYRSALGFGDHHAFDYLLVALAITGLLVLVNERADWRTATRRRILGLAVFVLAVGMQVHAWRGGPLLILPVAAYVFLRVGSDVRAGESPLEANAWTLAALAVAAVLALLPHVAFGWSGAYRALAPALLFAGSLVVVGIGEPAVRRGIRARTVLGLEVVGSLAAGVVAWVAVPSVRSAGQRGIYYFTRTGQTSITETYSLLSPEYGVITTPIFYLGFAFFLAVAALVWAALRVRREHRPTWLALTVYTGGFFLAALVQLRFAGHLAILFAIFSGLGFVYLVAAVDATALPRPFVDTGEPETVPPRFRETSDDSSDISLPDRESTFAVVALFLLVGSMGIAQTVGGTNDLTIEGTTYDAASAIDDHAAAANISWPDNYVFSDWGRNRVYNYYVNNQSRSYAYAQNHYDEFVTSSNASAWYDQLTAKPTGYVVVKDLDENFSQTSLQSRLWEDWGSRSDGVDGLGHYRGVYANDGRKVFDLVRGAMLVGQGEPGQSQTVSTEFDAGGESHTYERRVTPTANGWYAVRVPYNGTYDGADTSVPDEAVENGSFVGPNSERNGTANWPLNASRGDVAFDVAGGNHGWIDGATWTDEGLRFDGNDTVRVPANGSLNAEGDFALSITFRTDNDTDYVDDVQFPRLAGTAFPSRFVNTTGYQIAMRRGHIVGSLGTGSDAPIIQGQRVDDGHWHTATLARDGETVRLLLDGQVVGERQYTGTVSERESFAFGSILGGRRGFVGDIRAVEYNDGDTSANETATSLVSNG